MNWVQQPAIFSLFCIYFWITPLFAGSGDQPTLKGNLPVNGAIESVEAGAFFNSDQWDVLVQVDAASAPKKIYKNIGQLKTYRLELYSFDGKDFNIAWKSPFCFTDYFFIPHFWHWCIGAFDTSSNLCKVVALDSNQITVFSFRTGKKPEAKKLKMPHVKIDQIIGCDLFGDGKDELVTLECPVDCPDSGACCPYLSGIYKIVNDSLVQIRRESNMDLGGNFGIVRAPQFISKCRMKNYSGEQPVILEPQSDVSVSSYSAIVTPMYQSFG